MVEVWVPLFTGSVLVVIGFLAAQLFDRFRLPDYVVLLGVGVVLGSGVLPLGDLDPGDLLLSATPVLLGVAVAFILFEGGLALHLRGLERAWGLATFHTVVSIGLSVLGAWLAGTYLLGFAPLTSLILGVAMGAPSAAIVLSFLPRLRVSEKARLVLTLESVLGNIVAAALVLTLVRFPGGLPLDATLGPFVVNAVLAFMVAAAVGVAWDRVVGSERPRSFMYMTSVAIALLLYAIGEGMFDHNGAIAAFAFGLVLGHWGPSKVESPTVPVGSKGLQEFHGQIVFLLRTFFFVYLGTLIDVSEFTTQAVIGAAVLTTVFAASRWPTIALAQWTWRLPKSDGRVLRAVVARGLTDTVLVLLAISAGVIPPQEAVAAANLLFVVVIMAAVVSAVLVSRAERAEVPLPAPVAASPPAPVPRPSVSPSIPPPPPDDEPVRHPAPNPKRDAK